MASNDKDDRARLRGYVQFNKYLHTHTQRVGLVATDPDNLDNSKEAGGEA